jgi:hypothetical protein
VSKGSFNYKINDSQGTDVEPILIKDFNLEKYHDYESSLSERCKDFWNKKKGVAVYRRFRVPRVFASACKDMKTSLEFQLGALNESMKYKADIPNFLEPWYGIGTITSAFGVDYIWYEGQAPAVNPSFNSIEEVLNYQYLPVEKTEIGKHTLDMVEYFLEKTKGKIPLSFADIQSPLDIASLLLPIDKLFLEMYDNPEKYTKLLSIIVNLLLNFTKKQQELIGDALVYPGHGFASSRHFKGIGMSDDNTVMVSNDFYKRFEIPFREKIGLKFGGYVFHSCGNWSKKISVIKKISNLVMVDGAFSEETDPDPNTVEPFAEQFVNTGIIVNARIVGDIQIITETVKKLWKPGIKLIVVTYCKSPAEQEEVYKLIHEICCN